ncbi:ATP-binding protein [Parapedobacter tibetensis]|uniref:ATP-binding protein n=1 Tax=Parapedobacter tibetensis TaxID=2972951 RepID=UPI00214D9DB1|nr:ATP-binding protein [Parapedobacter tibetensis]
MTKNKKNTPVVRKVLLVSFILLFLIIGGIFIYQHRQYDGIEKRLVHAYQLEKMGSESLNHLLTMFSEAENRFRMYTVDFDTASYHQYLTKLDSVKYLVDSLASLPLADNPLAKQVFDVGERNQISLEFIALKRNVEYLVFHTQDSLTQIQDFSAVSSHFQTIEPESIVRTSLQDTFYKKTADTIVREKQGLIQRIFNAKNDTIVVNRQQAQHINTDQLSVIQTNKVTSGALKTKRPKRSNNDALKVAFTDLQQKERQLINRNLQLLGDIKSHMYKIKSLENKVLRAAEETDFALFRKNAGTFRNQLIFALSLMLLMILSLIYYDRYASSYERRLYQEKDYASKLAEEKTSVLANISHEIRTPLNSLLGIIDLLKSRTTSKNPDEKLVDSAYYSINVISSTINDILSLSKLETSNKGSIVMDFFSPERTCREVISLHKNQAELKDLEIRTEIDIDPKLGIFSNEFRVRQIASNFVSNAIKYSHSGDIVFRASILKANDWQSLHIEVEDSGLGISEQYRRQIFRKYYTVNNHSGGFGLGLYISKVMAEELGGKINFRSKLGKGSTFYMDIPFEKTMVKAREQRTPRLSDLSKDLGILIVDDNPINILYMKQFFTGFKRIHTVNSGKDALQVLEQHAFDIVITDINMPDMRGDQLLQNIRSRQDYQQVKILAISADFATLGQPKEQGNAITFDGYIEKPFTESELVKALLGALKHYEV